jgi:hypothetical protein
MHSWQLRELGGAVNFLYLIAPLLSLRRQQQIITVLAGRSEK